MPEVYRPDNMRQVPAGMMGRREDAMVGEGQEMTSLDLYKLAFDNWRFQVNSYWQRSSYFAAFEIAAVAGVWRLINQQEVRAGIVFALLGLALTVVWIMNNRRTHGYVRYWWSTLQQFEAKIEGGPKWTSEYDQNALQFGIRKGPVQYSQLVQAIPVIFSAAWIVLLVEALNCI